MSGYFNHVAHHIGSVAASETHKLEHKISGAFAPSHPPAPPHLVSSRVKYDATISIDGSGTKTYPSPAAYNAAVSKLLDRIKNSHTGSAVFYSFEKLTNKTLLIVPYEMKDFNAYATTKDLKHATLKGDYERSGKDGAILKDAHGRPIVGQGGGSDAQVHYSPTTWTSYCSKSRTKSHRSGAQPDEVLLHEMTHASREMAGVFSPRKLDHLYDTEEEFFAILIANIYASETGRPTDLRESHAGHERLNHRVDTSAKFLPAKNPNDYRYRLIRKLVNEEPKMAHKLRQIHAAFNPIRRFFQL